MLKRTRLFALLHHSPPQFSSPSSSPQSASPSSASALSSSTAPQSTTTTTTTTAPPKPKTKPEEKWSDLRRLLVTVKKTKVRNVTEDVPIAVGSILGEDTEYRVHEHAPQRYYRVRFQLPPLDSNGGAQVISLPEREAADPASTQNAQEGGGGHRRRQMDLVRPPLALPIGTRVRVFYGPSVQDGFTAEGIIIRVNGNATYSMLMDNGEVELSVSPHTIFHKGAVTKILPTHPAYTNRFFQQIHAWLEDVVPDARDRKAMALALYLQGWREEHLYLLEPADLDPLRFIHKHVRTKVLEKAQHERDNRHVMRFLQSERVKDRDLRYFLSKYKGTLSCVTGMFVVGYVFVANLRAYRQQQRSHQLALAVQTIVEARPPIVHEEEGDLHIPREKQEQRVRSILTGMNLSHPHIIAFTGFDGCGKTFLVRTVVHQLGLSAIFVDLHGKEDTLRSIAKALGVQNVDVCGDLLDFVAEAMQRAAREKHGRVPVISIKLRKGTDLERVYKEAVPLASDRHACHILLEVPLSLLTSRTLMLPRLDFHVVPNFTRAEAFAYTHNSLDPLELNQMVETIGTNSNDLDDFYAAVLQRKMPAISYISRRTVRAMRRVQGAMHAAATSMPVGGSANGGTNSNHANNKNAASANSVANPSTMGGLPAPGGTLASLGAQPPATTASPAAPTGTAASTKSPNSTTTSPVFARAPLRNETVVHDALKQLARMPFEKGLRNDTPEDFDVLFNAALSEIVLYDPIRDRFLFTQKIFHTAVRCMQ